VVRGDDAESHFFMSYNNSKAIAIQPDLNNFIYCDVFSMARLASMFFWINMLNQMGLSPPRGNVYGDSLIQFRRNDKAVWRDCHASG
jgi:hypothetical protein